MRLFGAAGLAAIAGCTGGSRGNEGESDEPVDETGESEVGVDVGAGNGYQFDPTSVRVSTGTTVVWEWTGRGGQHNVAARDGSFESELAVEAGTTFSHTFDGAGTYEYVCVPHEQQGMIGAVEVVEE
ncbi:halocyanin domain-containing protein [Halegenticoccus tardaugens]|uniref:halocyanin domain-containing protein n=1 Tax=Halegenticoccus tardaugens TaxID=2071624 RepID=UPI001E3F2FB9|nr:halocyanin domain-containing protein [Halegenticoccus tardaugens]